MRRISGAAAFLAALVVLTAVATGPFLGSTAAQAQGTVVISSPADYTALGAAPTTIDLNGERAPDPVLSHVTVWDSAGKAVDAGATLARRGDVLTRPVAINAVGDFTVTYHIVFTDGSDAIGVVHFSVGTGVPPAVPTGARQRTDTANAQAHEHGGVDPVGAFMLVLDLVVLLGVIIMLIRTPKPRR